MAFSFLITPYDLLQIIAKQAKEKRLSFNMSQKSLSERSGVSLGVIKKFEQTGKISIESLLKIALILDALEEFKALFSATPIENFPSLDFVLKQKTRKRGRQ